MKCEKCLKERSRGDLYTFYYGSRAGTPAGSDPGPAGRMRQANYRIAGHASAWICDRCVRAAQLRHIALVAALPLLLFLAAYQVPGAEAVCAAAGMLLLVALPVLTFAARREFGEGVAIRARKKELRSQNYNAFLSTDTFNRMNIS